MANVTIRNLDDGIVEALKARAKANNRSLEGELRQILSDAVDRSPYGTGGVARAGRSKTKTCDVPQTESVLLFREDRDR